MNQNIDQSFPRSRFYGDEKINWLLDYFEYRMERKLGGQETWNRRYAMHIHKKVGAETFRQVIDWVAEPACWWHLKINQMQNIYKNIETLTLEMRAGKKSQPRKTHVTII